MNKKNEEQRTQEIYKKLHTPNKKTVNNYKEILEYQYELGIDYFINTKK